MIRISVVPFVCGLQESGKLGVSDRFVPHGFPAMSLPWSARVRALTANRIFNQGNARRLFTGANLRQPRQMRAAAYPLPFPNGLSVANTVSERGLIDRMA